MLVSMNHTSEALQTLGLKVSDADNIMLDLEESASDVTNLQNTLSTSSFDNDFSEVDLHEELALLLGDDDAESIGRHVVKTAGKQAEENVQLELTQGSAVGSSETLAPQTITVQARAEIASTEDQFLKTENVVEENV